jgi:TP901 family phage tail tape measure protein
MSTFTVPSIFTAVDKYTAPLRKMTSSTSAFTKKAEVGVSKLNRRLNKLTPSFGGLKQQIVGLASAAVAFTFIKSAAKDVMDFEKSIASLSAITGASGAVLDGFVEGVNKVAKETKSSSIEVAKAFELVGSAKPELLKDAEALGEVTKNAIVLSQATGEDLETSVQSLTGTLNQFGLGAESARMVIDTLAAGSKEGAAAVPQITEALDKFGTVAAASNVGVAESVGLIETLAEKNIKGAEAGTKLRNVLVKMSTAKSLPKAALDQLEKFGVNTDLVADKTVPLNERLKELSKIQNDATALAKVFGSENLVAGQVLLQNVEKVDKYTEAVKQGGVAQEQADKNMSTLSARLDQLSNAWTNILTSSNSASGGLNVFKGIIVFVTDNLETIVGVIGSAVAVFGILKLGVMAAQGALWAYRTAMLISSIATGTMTKALALNEIALGAYAAVQWVANAALWGFPLVWIIGAIIAVGAAIVALVVYWEDLVKWVTESDSVFAKIIRAALFPIVMAFKAVGAAIGWLIDMFSSLIEWVQTSDSGFAQFIRGTLQVMADSFRLIGAGIDVVIDAFSSMWDWVSKFTSDALAPVMAVIDMFSSGTQDALGVDVNKNINGAPGADGEEAPAAELLNPKKAEQDGLNTKIEEVKTSNLNVNINDPGGNATVESDATPVGVQVSSTTGF